MRHIKQVLFCNILAQVILIGVYTYYQEFFDAIYLISIHDAELFYFLCFSVAYTLWNVILFLRIALFGSLGEKIRILARKGGCDGTSH